MPLIDAVLLVSTAAVGLGAFETIRRGLFRGWIWILERGLPDVHAWSGMEILVLFSDLAVFLIPVVAPWTLYLLARRLMTTPRATWRRIWRQPGMVACLAALFGWCWGGAGLLFALAASSAAQTTRIHAADAWAQKVLSDEVFMYVGLAVATAWLALLAGGRWRRSIDWIDSLGRLTGLAWIVIGLIWTVREYLEFI
jgi:hypothetical protein